MKRLITILSLIATLAAGALLPSCANRYREYDLDIASTDVDQHFSNLGPYITTADTTGGIATQLFNSAAGIRYSAGSTAYYSFAPSSLGPMKNAFAVDWTQLFPLNGSSYFTPSRAYAFFMVTRGEGGAFYGSLVITNLDQDMNPPGNEQPFIFVASNDGTTALPGSNLLLYPGESDDEMFQMELNLNGRTQLVVRSYDIVEGDLAEVVQLEVYRVDEQGESYIGKLNFVPQE